VAEVFHFVQTEFGQSRTSMCHILAADSVAGGIALLPARKPVEQFVEVFWNDRPNELQSGHP
jgi:hypothetical protein